MPGAGLERGLDVLRVLLAAPKGLGPSALAREVGGAKSSVLAALRVLTDEGFAERGPDRTYRATTLAWRLGIATADATGLREAARRPAEALASRLREMVYVVQRDGDRIVYVDKIEVLPSHLRWSQVGDVPPLHCTAGGKALLAATWPDLVGAALRDARPYTLETVTTRAAMEAEMRRTRTRGYAIERAEFRPESSGLGVAVHDPARRAVGALVVSLPMGQIAALGEGRIAADLRATVRAVEAALAQAAPAP
ncbi:MAG: IclR family transcriptional regulator [Shimia sp.]